MKLVGCNWIFEGTFNEQFELQKLALSRLYILKILLDFFDVIIYFVENNSAPSIILASEKL